MAPGMVITASVAGAAGVKVAPYLREMCPGSDGVKTAVVAGGGLAVAAGGAAIIGKNAYVGAGLVGFGLGTSVGAVCEHFGF